jgi:xylulokinase
VGISTLGDSLTLLDAVGSPISNTVVGAADRRAVKQTQWLHTQLGRDALFQKTGAPLHAFSMVPKIIWFRDNLPEEFARAARFTGWQEIIHTLLGVDPRMDYSLASRTMLLDIRAGDWAYDLLERCGISHRRFFPLAWASEIVGRTPRSLLGLAPGVQIAAGGFDQCCCAIGAGVLRPGTAALSVGTLEALTAIYDRCRIEKPLLDGNHGCGFHALKGRYFSLGYVTTSGGVLRWYRDTFGAQETDAASKCGRDPYELIIEPVPDRPSSVYVLPYFAGAGTPWLDLNQRGSIFGLTLSTERSEIVKGILDGTCYEIRINVESLAAAGIDITRFRAIGGGARSNRWMQLKADVTGIPVETTRVAEAGCLGAAFLAGLGSGIYGSPQDLEGIVSVDRVFEPRPDQTARYQESFQMYRELRSRMEGLSIR